MQRLALLIARKVAVHEPRLTNVRATVTSPAGSRGVAVCLSASLRAGSILEPVTFPLTIDRNSIKGEPA